MGRINVTSIIFAGTLVPNSRTSDTWICAAHSHSQQFYGSFSAFYHASLCQGHMITLTCNFYSFHMIQLALPCSSYLLGLLAMIKCSICSYQCDNWYVSNWRLACHINFCLGRCSLELARGPSRVALAWHFARRSTPFGVTTVAERFELPTFLLGPVQHLSLSRDMHPYMTNTHTWCRPFSFYAHIWKSEQCSLNLFT